MSLKAKQALITAHHAITPYGENSEEFYTKVCKKEHNLESGIGKLKTRELSFYKDKLDESKLTSNRLNSYLTVYSAKKVLEASNWTSEEIKNAGLIIASTTGYTPSWEANLAKFFKNEISVEEFSKSQNLNPLGSMLSEVQNYFNFEGPTNLLTTACTASAQALGLALNWIRTGKVEKVLIGAAEFLSPLTIEGFSCFQILSSEQATPFDQNRKGINLSDTICFLAIEADRGSKSGLLVKGAGYSSDAYHSTAPHPEGRGCKTSMLEALTDSNLTPNQIDWIYTHGTGSVHNDQSESLAIKSVFKESVSDSFFTSTKGTHGHTLAASTALELILLEQSFKHQKLLPTSGFQNLDPNIGYSPIKNSSNSDFKHVLKNALGFGGANCSLVLSYRGSK